MGEGEGERANEGRGGSGEEVKLRREMRWKQRRRAGCREAEERESEVAKLRSCLRRVFEGAETSARTVLSVKSEFLEVCCSRCIAVVRLVSKQTSPNATFERK